MRHPKLLATVTLAFAAVSVHSQELSTLVLQAPVKTAVYVLDGDVALAPLAPLQGPDILYHLPGTPADDGVTSVRRYRFLGYAPSALHLAPGSYHLYAFVNGDVIPFDVTLGPKTQTWNLQPRNVPLLWTAAILASAGFYAAEFATGSAYVDAVHGKGFSTGAAVLTSGIAALGLGILGIAASLPSVKSADQ